MAEEVSPLLHKVYDLVALSDNRVTVTCADCGMPLGTTVISAWGAVAEEHYREEALKRERPRATSGLRDPRQ